MFAAGKQSFFVGHINHFSHKIFKGLLGIYQISLTTSTERFTTEFWNWSLRSTESCYPIILTIKRKFFFLSFFNLSWIGLHNSNVFHSKKSWSQSKSISGNVEHCQADLEAFTQPNPVLFRSEFQTRLIHMTWLYLNNQKPVARK